MNKQQKEFYRLFSEHGTGDAKVCITPQEVLLLLYITRDDLSLPCPCKNVSIHTIAQKGLYNISYNDIDSLPSIKEDTCFQYMNAWGITNCNNIAFLYLKNLCALYRRRVKYYHILKHQPFPNAEQIAPRSILEYGNCDNALLANFLEWRKWIFDIDNRSAQETGYIFEPILASCLGGEPLSAKLSPVKRIDDNGNPMDTGRQVDCYIEEKKEVYELKMRVTIAASGQGRFEEEKSFPYEAQRAGFTPILVVFDGNESSLLTALKTQYINCGGRCYIGEEAWEMLRREAGKEMSIFINKYIYPPVNSMSNLLQSNPNNITLENNSGEIVISGNSGRYVIKRE